MRNRCRNEHNNKFILNCLGCTVNTYVNWYLVRPCIREHKYNWETWESASAAETEREYLVRDENAVIEAFAVSYPIAIEYISRFRLGLNVIIESINRYAPIVDFFNNRVTSKYGKTPCRLFPTQLNYRILFDTVFFLHFFDVDMVFVSCEKRHQLWARFSKSQLLSSFCSEAEALNMVFSP